MEMIEHTGEAVTTVRLLTRFRAIDEETARKAADLLRAAAAAVAAEPGHLTYDVFAVEDDTTTLYVLETWMSSVDARRHADFVREHGAIDRMLPLLNEPLDTMTLEIVASQTAAQVLKDGRGGAA